MSFLFKQSDSPGDSNFIDVERLRNSYNTLVSEVRFL